MRTCFSRPLSPLDVNVQAMLTRREWVRRFVIGSATVLAGGAGRSTLLAEISASALPSNILKLNLASFPALAGADGSVQVSVFGSSILNGIITVTREGNSNVFHAVSASCTHSQTITDKYLGGDTNAIICYAHGSVYNIRGEVLVYAESPAQPNLPYYASSLSGGTLRVEIPNLNLKVNQIAVQSVNGATTRYALQFPTRQGATYRVLYTPDLVTAPAPQPFYTTAGGVSTVNQVVQSTPTPNPRTVYVDSVVARGFFFVELVTSQYA